MNSAAQWFRDNHLIKHLLVIAALLGSIYIGTRILDGYVAGITDRWVKMLVGHPVDALKFSAGSTITADEQRRLGELFNTIKERSNLHLDIMNYYYARFFTAIIMFSFTGALAAILLILVGKKGWAEENWNKGTGLIFTAFFVVTAATVYFNSWPGVFQLERSISDNKILTLQYLALENEVLTYAVTNEALNYSVSIDDLQKQPVSNEVITSTTDISGTVVINKSPQQIQLGRQMTPKEFIHYIDLRLSKDNIAVGFDFKQVPNYENIFNTQ